MAQDRRLESLSARYRILGEIGAGGMGTVYRAHDVRHDRDVAIKVLPLDVAAGLGTDRFLAEIRITAKLHHPHILPLFDSGEIDGLLFYVSPFVTGETLRHRIDREGPLQVEEALRITLALASALDHAHRHGVLHRDLKPENILLQDGTPLLADFGIARAVSDAAANRLTRTGVFVGTPLYASPEQAAGERETGPSTDVYSLAAVLYEMLTGEPPFTGRTMEAVMARILTEPPRSIRLIRPAVPAHVEAAVLRALAKIPADWPASMAVFADALRGGRGARPLGTRRNRVVVMVFVAVVLTGGLIAFVSARDRTTPAPLRSETRLTFTGRATVPAISPSGEFLAYVLSGDTSAHVVVQDLAGGEPDTVLTLTGVGDLDWSPDGTRLLVSGWESNSGPGTVVLVHRSGGQPRYLAQGSHPNDGPSGFARWVSDQEVSLRQFKLERFLLIDLAAGDTAALIVPGLVEGYDWTSDGERVVVSVSDSSRNSLRVLSRDGRATTLLEDTVVMRSPHWATEENGIYFARGDQVWRVNTGRTGRPRGDPTLVASGLDGLGECGCEASMTDDGRLVYTEMRAHSNLVLLEHGADGPGRMRPLTTGTALHNGAAVSPDGRSIAYVERAGNTSEIFTIPVEGGPPKRQTFGGNLEVPFYASLAWSPSGDSLVFSDGRLTLIDLRVGSISRLPEIRSSSGFVAWAPDTAITYLVNHQSEIRRFQPQTGTHEVVLRGIDGSEFFWGPAIAPDGNRLAIQWIGTEEVSGVWIIDLDDRSRVRVKVGIGMFPRVWSADSRYIYLQRFNRGPEAYRLDTHATLPTEPEMYLDTPYREADCVPAGPLRPEAFVCTEYGYVSDITLVDLDPR